MIKVFFESSIFLHQKNGGISKYIQRINKNFLKYNIKSIIYSPITINDNLNLSDKKNIYYLKINKIPRFFRKILYGINNFLTLLYIELFKPDIVHFSYYNEYLSSFIKIPYVITVYDLIHEKIYPSHNTFKKKN